MIEPKADLKNSPIKGSFNIMKTAYLIFLILILSLCISGQSDLKKLVETEKAFAGFAAEKGTKLAFLEFLADDAVVFNPKRTNGKELWKARPASPSLLSWFPAWADISGNGSIGYTTGPWEFRAKGKDDTPTAFGHYVTIWEKRQDGNFKAVLDIGISHEKPQSAESEFKIPDGTTKDAGKGGGYAGDSAAVFFEMIGHGDTEAAYKAFAADDIRLLRNDNAPYIGKKTALSVLKKTDSKLVIKRRISFFGTTDLEYVNSTYTRVKGAETVESGNFVQIWKFRDGKWKIVLDIFLPEPKA